jgi:hypothetical protein
VRGRWQTRRTGAERGEGAVGYASVLLVISLIVGALFTIGVPDSVAGGIKRAVCDILQGDCQGSDRTRGTASEGGGQGEPGQGEPGQGAPGQGAPQGAPQGTSRQNARGGGFGRGRGGAPVALVRDLGSWLLPGSPGSGDPRDDGEDAREAWNDSNGDLDEWLDDVEDMIEEHGSDPEDAADFLEELGPYTVLEIFNTAMDEYDEYGNGRLDADELRRARRELGPLAEMLGDALSSGELSSEFRTALMTGDSAEVPDHQLMAPRSLAMMMDLAPAAFPPDFMVQATRNIINSPEAGTEAWLRAIHALGGNGEAAQLLLGNRDNLRQLLEREPFLFDADRTGRGPQYLAQMFDAALGDAPDTRAEQRAFANIVDHINDTDAFNTDDMAPVRRRLADHLEPYLPWLSRVGQRDNTAITDNPGNSDPPGPPLPVSGDRMIEFLGVLMGDTRARNTINDMAQRYADRIDPIGAITPTSGGAAWQPFLDRVDVVAGLYTTLANGQNAARLSSEQRRVAALEAHDSFTRVVNMGLGRVPVAGEGLSQIFGAVSGEVREDIDEEQQGEVAEDAVSPEVRELISDWQSDVAETLRQRHPGAAQADIDATAEMITRTYSGTMLPVVLDILEGGGN